MNYTFCNDEYAESLAIDLDFLKAEVSKQYPDIFFQDETVIVTESYYGISKITSLSAQPEIQNICDQIEGIHSYFEVAVNASQEIFISTGDLFYNSKILKIDENCIPTPIINDFQGDIQAMSFDKSDNLYVSDIFNSSSVYRADANDLSHFYEWHNFGQGSASGDFVEKEGFLYIAWNVGGTDYLYKVSLDNDNQYVSHVNLGSIRNNTYGLANEYGILYGVTPNSLYRIDESTMNTFTIVNNPSQSSSRKWWGAAGLHEAIDIEFKFFNNLQNAEIQTNELSSPYPLNTENNHTLYVRINNVTTGEYFIYPIEIIITTPPKIEMEENITICEDSGGYLLETNLDSNNYDIQWWKDGVVLEGENQKDIWLTQAGTYKVVAGDFSSQCVSEKSATLSKAFVVIENIELEGASSIKINATGNEKPFEYQLDGKEWGLNSQFDHLESGIHQVQVRNQLGCYSDIETIVIGISNTITPNGDGINDCFRFPYVNGLENATYQIFDKYGKKISEGHLQPNTYWDGHYEGRALPTGSYWYQIEANDSILYSGYIFLKNR